MTEKERIESIRTLLKFNKKTFSEVLGYTHSQNYTKYLNGTSKLPMKAMKSLLEYDSNFNINWILTGQGEMFLSKNEGTTNKEGQKTHSGDHNKDCGNTTPENKEVEYLKGKIELLEKALEEKDARLKDKDKLISLLEKNQKK